MNIYRQMTRQETFRRGEEAPKVLDGLNEAIYEKQGRYLHPTKGFRNISVRRGRAQMIMAEQRAGKFPPQYFHLRAVTKVMREFIRTGLWTRVGA